MQPLTTTSTLLPLVLTIFGVQIARLWRNYAQAKNTGLPVIVTPLLETQILAQIATPFLRAVYLKYLDQGKGWPRWCRFMIHDWSWEDRRRAHEEYGDVFVVVSTEGMICYSADAKMGWNVMNRRLDFTKPRDKYKLLELYGPNVGTAEGAEFSFHVRITGPPFSDGSGVNELVWSETMCQTRNILRKWEQEAPGDFQNDINALTLAVISFAGFGRKLESVTEQSHEIPSGYNMSFFQAVRVTTAYMFAILLIPGWLMKITPLAKAQIAYAQLDKYLREMISKERVAIESGGTVKSRGPTGNLLQSVLQSSYDYVQKGEQQKTEEKTKKHGFTENEVLGNLFIFLLAGYETTANAIAYGLIVLALEPSLQQRVAAEVDHVWSNAEAQGRSELTYEDDFSQLKYLYGFMYEIFRLYPGVTIITKMCENTQPVEVGTTTHILPPGCRVYLSAPAVHYNDDYWENATELKPERWSEAYSYGNSSADTTPSGGHTYNPTSNDSKQTKSSSIAADKAHQRRGTLITFSDGARSCRGRKFAQTEYVAFFAALLYEFEVRLAEGVDRDQVRRDLDLKCAGRFTLTPLTGTRLEFKRREGRQG